jgi:hypothetical protein
MLQAAEAQSEPGGMKTLWAHVFGEVEGILAIFPGERSEPGS